MDEMIRRVADEVARWLGEAHDPAPALTHYAEVTLGTSEAAALRGALADPDHPEREVLLELLFFPDHALKVQVEPHVAEGGATGLDAAVTREVLARVQEGRFVLAGGEVLTVPLSEEAVLGLVRRLRIGATPPQDVRRAALQRLDALMAVRVGVLFRHARLEWSMEQTNFVVDALRNLPQAGEEMLDMLGWTAAFLGGLGAGQDILDGLRVRWREAYRNVGRAERFAKALASSNYETMIMQGIREPHFDTETLREDMYRADELARAVFRESVVEVQGEGPRDVGSIETADDMHRVLGLMGM